jgi:hypothetical protein
MFPPIGIADFAVPYHSHFPGERHLLTKLIFSKQKALYQSMKVRDEDIFFVMMLICSNLPFGPRFVMGRSGDELCAVLGGRAACFYIFSE